MANRDELAVTTEKVATEGQLVLTTVKTFNPLMTDVNRRWETGLRSRAADDAKLFYMMATDVVTIARNPEGYGDDAVERLWKVHHLDDATKKLYLLVGTTIKREFFEQIEQYNASANSAYASISAGHLILISSLPTDKARQKCFSLIKFNKWSIKSAKVWADEQNDKLGEKDSKPKRIVTMFGKIIKSAKQLIDSSDPLSNETFISDLESVDSKDTATAIERCIAIKEAYETICETGEDRIMVLDNVIQRLSDQRNATQARLAAKNQDLEDRQSKAKRKLAAAAEASNAAATNPAKGEIVQGKVVKGKLAAPVAAAVTRVPVLKKVSRTGSTQPAAKSVPPQTKQVTKSPTNPPMPAKKKKLVRRVINPS